MFLIPLYLIAHNVSDFFYFNIFLRLFTILSEQLEGKFCCRSASLLTITEVSNSRLREFAKVFVRNKKLVLSDLWCSLKC